MKIRNILLSLLTLTAVSCNLDNPVETQVLEVSTNNMVINSFGGDRPLSITANNAWTVDADVQWISFSQDSGEASAEKQQIMVYIDENTAEEARTGKITVTSGELSEVIDVNQDAAEAEPEPETALELSVAVLEAAAEAGEVTFTVTSNKDWTASTEADWVAVSPARGTASETAAVVTVSYLANGASEVRSTVIKLTAAEVEKTISLTQAAKVQQDEPELTWEGDGSEANPYLLKTAEHLSAMREKAALGSVTYFRLENDVDMSSVKNWVPVNFDGDYSRQIHFDGNNMTIRNFAPETYNYYNEDGSLSETQAGYHSLFGVFYGSVKNLKVDNATISGSNACGVIGGYVGTDNKPGLVENVTITNASVTNSGDRTGGVCGNAKEATFRNVSFQGAVTCTYTEKEAKSGGFAGQTQTSAVFENCSAEVVVTGSSNDLGGFVGKTTGEVSFKSCRVKAAVTSNAATKNRCGGFLGWNSTSKALFEDCHVLQGTTITNETERASASNGNFGGFIGFGDAAGTVTDIIDCSVHVVMDVDENSTYNGGFIGGTGYASTTTIKGCSAAGTVNGNNYVGGFFGASQGTAVIERCSASVDVTSTGQRSGSFVGIATVAITIRDCYSTGNTTAGGQQVGGILGYTGKVASVIERCYATGDITSNTAGTGGILGTSQIAGTTVSKCIAWNSNIVCNRADNAKWSTGAVVGASSVEGIFTDCYRRADMNFVDKAGAMELVDHENVTNALPAAPSYSEEATQRAYHGKAAPAGATVSSLAKSLGWDETVWDLSKDLPTLK